ncbi:MAG: ribosome small subunit-dependent GTPase A [Woeseia sp.]
MQKHNTQKARVVASYGRRLDLSFANGSEATGRVKGRRLQPVCGDFVLAERLLNEPEWLITEIVERRNELGRPNRQGKVDILAANIDLVIVITAELPDPDWFIVDRYLCAAELMSAAGAVVFNKTDLGEATPAIVDSMDIYREAGYQTLYCSAVKGNGMGGLRALIAERTAVVVGQSGVGKSTLINALFGDDSLTTAPVSRKRQEGRHTTVNAKMRTLASGGHVIDSPGVRDYAPAIAAAEEVAQTFPEIREAAPRCRFANCRHLQEPGCEVIEVVASGTFAARRYESYRRLYRLSLDFQRKTQ